MIRKTIETALHMVGFESICDFLNAVLALKTKAPTFYAAGFTYGGLLTFVRVVTDQTAVYIYSPPAGILILGIVSAVDFLLGVWNSVESKNLKFNSWRIPRSFVRLVVQIILVALIFNMNKVFPLIIQLWLVDGLLLIFTLTTFWSAVENARDLEIITKHQFEIIESFVNIKGLLNRFKQKNEDGNNTPN